MSAHLSWKTGQTMYNTKPLFDPTTHYRIEVQGRVDAEWLQGFDSSAEISVDETGQMVDNTVLDVHSDQSEIVGLVRGLHGLGNTIKQFQIIPQKEE
jgi:hypothetical protein